MTSPNLSRHYCALLEADFNSETLRRRWTTLVNALRNDPACIVAVNTTEAHAAQVLGLTVVQCVMEPTSLLMTVVYVNAEHTLLPVSFPCPWTPNPAHHVAGFRSMLTQSQRDALHKHA